MHYNRERSQYWETGDVEKLKAIERGGEKTCISKNLIAGDIHSQFSKVFSASCTETLFEFKEGGQKEKELVTKDKPRKRLWVLVLQASIKCRLFP